MFTKDGGWIISKNVCPSAIAATSKIARNIDMKFVGGTHVYDIYVPDAQEANAPCTNRYQAPATHAETWDTQQRHAPKEKAKECTELKQMNKKMNQR